MEIVNGDSFTLYCGLMSGNLFMGPETRKKLENDNTTAIYFSLCRETYHYEATENPFLHFASALLTRV